MGNSSSSEEEINNDGLINSNSVNVLNEVRTDNSDAEKALYYIAILLTVILALTVYKMWKKNIKKKYMRSQHNLAHFGNLHRENV